MTYWNPGMSRVTYCRTAPRHSMGPTGYRMMITTLYSRPYDQAGTQEEIMSVEKIQLAEDAGEAGEEREGSARTKPAAFNIMTVVGGFNGGRTLSLRVDSEASMQEWVTVLRAQVHKAKAAAEHRQYDSSFLRSRARAQQMYNDPRVQALFATVIAVSFISSLVEAEVLPEPESVLAHVLWLLEFGFAVIFSAELLINLYGSWMRAFLTNPWSILADIPKRQLNINYIYIYI